MSKTLLELDVTGQNMGDTAAVALGAALRKNRTITTLGYDRNGVTLEGFKAIRGCLYGNKKLVNVSAPAEDLAVSAFQFRKGVWASRGNLHRLCVGKGVGQKKSLHKLYPCQYDLHGRECALCVLIVCL